jgi:hypothetical protein
VENSVYLKKWKVASGAIVLFRLSNKIIHVVFTTEKEEIVISTKSVAYCHYSNFRKVALNSKIEISDPLIH